MKVHIHLEKLEIYSLPCNKSSYFLDSLILIFLCILSALKGHPCIQSNLSTYSLQCYIRLKQHFILIFPCQILIFLNITTESQKIFTFEGQHQNNHKHDTTCHYWSGRQETTFEIFTHPTSQGRNSCSKLLQYDQCNSGQLT